MTYVSVLATLPGAPYFSRSARIKMRKQDKMMRAQFRFRLSALMGGFALVAWLPILAVAQGAAPAPIPVQSAPLAAPPAPPAQTSVPLPGPPVAVAPPAGTPPAASVAPAQSVPVPPVPAIAAPVIDPNSLLAGGRGDNVNVDELMLNSKPAVMITGQANWDTSMNTLAKVFDRLKSEAEKAGLRVAGRPLTLFVETDDTKFRYEAMIPVDRVIEGQAGIGPDIRFVQTPRGKHLRFTHKAPYDDIDSTYEVLTAYLDAKGLTVRDAFLEEYVSELSDSDKPEFELNVYVQPQ
jgi:effector-binding domain-containing protein